MADSGIEIEKVEWLDPEMEFLATKRETGNEWELFKENVRPLKRGRKVSILNEALKVHNDNQLKISRLDQRRLLIQAIDEYKGEDPLHPWLECIKWVQEAFPPGGDSSGLVVIYEQCVRTFWHSDRYKDDLRCLKVWLEYAENCVDAQVIYSFLDANEIGKTHAVFYISYALLLESKNKMKAANETFNLGISRNAQPVEKLKDAYRKFIARSMRKSKAAEEDPMEKHLPTRSFGTVLSKGENRKLGSSDLLRNNLKADRDRVLAPINIYKESNSVDVGSRYHPDVPKTDLNSWHTLGPRAERNKENNAIPTKWTTYKIPQRPGSRTRGAGASSTCIEVFVDEECEEKHRMNVEEGAKSSTVQLRLDEERDLKRETELLREDPLRNFPPNSLPR
ncbi:mitotic spindle checkpoint protein BUBR1 [Pyrus ussuriensis x Pyrus communis]|uniref:Mitotic spindle checkpoint protein BUBR1 n=1 Tax=Pyrus ussuriensis x Pyrus communis TaxID=2448454 RepID=A0A5N5HYM7_9ROSA|nr:mitotic spindle checkpoint protein BUBR1 [Pyrus ussuriensis x Pyrus communis]